MKKCLYCRQIFEDKKHKNKVYCSRQCWNKSNFERCSIPCEQCRNLFIPSQHGKNRKLSRFCSWTCRIKSKDKIIKCFECGKEFRITNTQERRFCSSTCSNRYWSYRRKKNPKLKQSRQLKIKINNQLIVICRYCKKEYQIIKSRMKHTKYCSRECFLADERPIDKSKHAMFRCKRCNNLFEEWVYRNPTFCSNQCRSEYAARQPKPKQRRPQNFIIKKCLYCNKDFTVHKSQDTNGRTASYCSVPCKLASRISAPERICKAILEEIDISFEHQKLIKPNFYVDFIIEDKIILQVDGEYWHGHPKYNPLTNRQIAQQKRDKAQTAYLIKCGYKVIRIWESEVNKGNIIDLLYQEQ